jgi:phosphate transport system protein
MATRLEESLNRDIERIRSKVLEMSGCCERALRDCLVALRTRNRQLCYSVILGDRRIDELEKEVDRLCLEFLVRQQPAGGPLRFAYSTIRINLELERIGDYAESIARQSLKLLPMEVELPISRLEEIANLSLPMLHDGIRAFIKQDVELAQQTIETEEAVDVLKSSLNKDVVALFHKSQLPFEALNPLMMITRRLERVSDQAKNICMEVLYMCTGEYRRHVGNDFFRLLFVDTHNASLSQMAEAIGQSMNEPKFVFASAGIQPTSMDPGTAEFLKSKGHDPGKLRAKAVTDVPNLEHFHVIVALTPEAKRTFPIAPRKTVFLDWNLTEPDSSGNNSPERRTLIERSYDALREQIKDLVEAVVTDNE